MISNRYLLLGLGALGAAFAGTYFLIFRMPRSQKQLGKYYNPKQKEDFVIVIHGIGSHGDSSKDDQVDSIIERTVREMIEKKAQVNSAYFYSSSGPRNLLKYQD